MFAIFPEILNQTSAGDLESVTCLVRKYFGDGQVFTPNLRVAELCNNAEIKIRPDARGIAARMEAWDANGQFRIEISVHPDIKNQRELNYILALMLGHVFLDLQPKMAKGELQRSIFEKKQSPLRELLLSPESASATDLFASALILPKAMVKRAMSSLSSKKDVAAFFNVDLPLLEFRLLKLSLVTGAAKEEAPVRAQPKKEPAPAPRPASKPLSAKPVEKSAPEQELSSLARVNRSTATRSYKKEGEAVSESPKTEKKTSSPGLERLRELARKIDKSVSD
ncbi:MAG: hypothetical protein V4655_02855 [Bdellovibrionota bacterium]